MWKHHPSLLLNYIFIQNHVFPFISLTENNLAVRPFAEQLPIYAKYSQILSVNVQNWRKYWKSVVKKAHYDVDMHTDAMLVHPIFHWYDVIFVSFNTFYTISKHFKLILNRFESFTYLN